MEEAEHAEGHRAVGCLGLSHTVTALGDPFGKLGRLVTVKHASTG
jgi:hypothetical protein